MSLIAGACAAQEWWLPWLAVVVALAVGFFVGYVLRGGGL